MQSGVAELGCCKETINFFLKKRSCQGTFYTQIPYCTVLFLRLIFKLSVIKSYL